MSNLILAIIAAIVSVVLPYFPDFAGAPAPALMMFLLGIAIWQTLDGIKRLWSRLDGRFEFLFAMLLCSLAGLLAIWDTPTRPVWIVVACSAVVSNIIGFFKQNIRGT